MVAGPVQVSEETERKRRDQTVSPPKSGCEGDAEEALKENCPPTDENAPPSVDHGRRSCSGWVGGFRIHIEQEKPLKHSIELL